MSEFETILRKLDEIKRISVLSVKSTFTLAEAALYIGKSENATYKVVNQLPHFKAGKTLYIDKCELDKWMHSEREMSDRDFDRLAAIHCDNNPINFN